MNTFDSLRSLSMTGKLLILLSTMFVGSLSCWSYHEYQQGLLQHAQLASEFNLLQDKKDKVKNINDRLVLLAVIVTEAVKDGVFLASVDNNIITEVKDAFEPCGFLAIQRNVSALVPMQPRIQSEAARIKSLLTGAMFTAANLTALFKKLRAEKEEFSKITWWESVKNKYKEDVKPFFNKSAFWTSVGFAGIMASKIAYKKCLDFSDLGNQKSFVKALTLDNAAYLLATLAIVSHYLRK